MCDHMGKNCGMWIVFDNGYTLSIQWGAGTHSSYYGANAWDYISGRKSYDPATVTEVEIAVWDDKGNWCTERFTDRSGDTLGSQTANDVRALIDRISKA